MKNKQLWLAALMIITLVFTACSAGSDVTGTSVIEGTSAAENTNATQDSTKGEASSTDKLIVVTTLFPQYDFAREIGGDYVDVTLILPPGVEAHSYEPTPQDMVLMQEADLFLYTGDLMEPWAVQIRTALEEAGVKVVDLSKGITLLSSEEEGHDHEDHDHEGEDADHEDEDHEDEDHEDEDHDHGSSDPHIWTDPNLAIIMSENILNAFVEEDAKNTSYYEENADKLITSLKNLDADIRAAVEKMQSKTILSGGHFAFGYFVKQYGLEHMSPYAGFSPDAEPTPQRIAELIKTINQTGAKAIFYEELVDPKVASTISDETGAEMLLLHGVHNVTKEEIQSGKTYVDFMRENLERLKVGLDYHE